MPSVDASSFCHVVVVAPTTRVDVALPPDLPVIEYVADLLIMVGENSSDGGSSHDGWYLSRADGSRLDLARSLNSQDVVDGAILRLTEQQPIRAEPIFDDVVDAIAARAKERLDDRSIILEGGVALIVAGVIVSSLILLALPRSVLTMATAALPMVLSLGMAHLVAGRLNHPRLSMALIPAGAAAAALEGVQITPRPTSLYTTFLSGSLMIAFAVISTIVLGRGTGFGVFASILALGAMIGSGLVVGFQLELYQAAAAVATLALQVMATTPWFALRMARIPFPMIPTQDSDLKSPDLNHDFGKIGQQGILAMEYQSGAMAGCAILAGLGAGYAAGQVSLGTGILGILVLCCLLLRVRSLRSMVQRSAMILSIVAGISVTALNLFHKSDAGIWVFTGLLFGLLMATAFFMISLTQQRTVNPVLARLLDLFESFAIAALVPVCLWVMGLIAIARHL